MKDDVFYGHIVAKPFQKHLL